MEAQEKRELSCCDNELKWESLCKVGALLDIQFRLFVTVQSVRCLFFTIRTTTSKYLSLRANKKVEIF